MAKFFVFLRLFLMAITILSCSLMGFPLVYMCYNNNSVYCWNWCCNAKMLPILQSGALTRLNDTNFRSFRSHIYNNSSCSQSYCLYVSIFSFARFAIAEICRLIGQSKFVRLFCIHLNDQFHLQLIWTSITTEDFY